eukprot:385445-Amorphochlora_amoeboformis.AAC.2
MEIIRLSSRLIRSQITEGWSAMGKGDRKDVSKAKKATKAMKKGKLSKNGTKIRTRVQFKLPKTLKLMRNPKYSKKALVRKTRLDKFTIVKYPLCTESAMKQIEDNNTLTFIVDIMANKRQIKKRISGVGKGS